RRVRRPAPTSRSRPLHDALPISDDVRQTMAEPALPRQMVRTRIRPHEAVPDLDVLGKFRSRQPVVGHAVRSADGRKADWTGSLRDLKSTRLNSSHEWISYAVFCL